MWTYNEAAIELRWLSELFLNTPLTQAIKQLRMTTVQLLSENVLMDRICFVCYHSPCFHVPCYIL